MGVASWITIDELSGPDETVERFLTAAKNRDVDAALAEVLPKTLNEIRTDDPDVYTEHDGEDAFLTDKAMRTDWDFGWISAGPKGVINESGTATVSAEITGLGQTKTAVFELTETKHGWMLDDPFVYVSLPYTPLTYLDIDGVRAEDPALEMIDPRPSFPVFPGTHRFFDDLPADVDVASSPKRTKLLAQTKWDDDGNAPAVRLGELTLNGDLLDQARRSIRSLFDTCAATKEAVPEPSDDHVNQGCPFEMQIEFDIGDEVFQAREDHPVTWDVKTPPEFDIVDVRDEDPDKAWALNSFEAQPVKPGRLVVSGVAEGFYGTNRNLKFSFDCEFAPRGLRGRLDSDDAIAMRLLPESEAELVIVNEKDDGCSFEHTFVPKGR
ncbi:hypothetical protein [Stackebrandtia nassauensis]|uniref:hypothetical protein n=1 Tax=Stackebrandtia nassauensis TaxID=283811 RepID=UPI0011853627|nr:hypothetical protein [Stackebrandtia nassauensis]